MKWAADPQETMALPMSAAKPLVRTVSVFLASSEELRAHRDELELYLRQQNDRFRERGWYEHFWTRYQDTDGLKLQARDQLEKLIDAGRL